MTRFNEIDIAQTKQYIKLHNKTYIEKILTHHHWIHNENKPAHEFPIPMDDSNEFKKSLETATPFTAEELKQHEKILD